MSGVIESLDESALRTIRAQAVRIKILESALKVYAFLPLGLGRPARAALAKSSYRPSAAGGEEGEA